jgi:hypothetical protein
MAGLIGMAVLLIQVSRGSKITVPFEALIDSGATNCLFHSDIAAIVGIMDFKPARKKRPEVLLQTPGWIYMVTKSDCI